jgi:hypothetical protein
MSDGLSGAITVICAAFFKILYPLVKSASLLLPSKSLFYVKSFERVLMIMYGLSFALLIS